MNQLTNIVIDPRKSFSKRLYGQLEKANVSAHSRKSKSGKLGLVKQHERKAAHHWKMHDRHQREHDRLADELEKHVLNVAGMHPKIRGFEAPDYPKIRKYIKGNSDRATADFIWDTIGFHYNRSEAHGNKKDKLIGKVNRSRSAPGRKIGN